jgi:hypothetical protein
MEIEVKIRGLMVDPTTNMPIVVLKDVNSEAVIPIWVGIYEANAIAIEIEKHKAPRPLTHDLLKDLIYGLNGCVQRVVITEVNDETYFAGMWLEQSGESIYLDARPSDAIAIALRADVPIFVEEKVLQLAQGVASAASGASTDLPRKSLDDLGDEDFGRYKM